jgi:hypothetical protein
MAWLKINPRYRELCEQHGLAAAEDFLALPAVIISGHPNRHVTRIVIGNGPTALVAYLKREHRISWGERLRNAWSGFGLVSRSSREASVLRKLEQSGIGCPEEIAVGEDPHGRGFLLLSDMAGAVELRHYLRDRQLLPERRRDRFARKLGKALAHLHNLGFDHPDLYSKHVFIDPARQTIRFVDWQRSRPRNVIGWRRRWRDLAALGATLDDDLMPQRERILCLRAYLRECRVRKVVRPSGLLHSAYRILALQRRLLRRRRIRELREVPLTSGCQDLVWRDGEGLCLTPEFQAVLQGKFPDWLWLANLPSGLFQSEVNTTVDIAEGRKALLVRRRERCSFGRLWSWLRSRRHTSPEIRQAGLLFRLQRYRIPGPRVLAFGQRLRFPGKVESFLLTECASEATPLRRWLREQIGSTPDVSRERRRLIHEAGSFLRRMHEAGCYLGKSRPGQAFRPLQVQRNEQNEAIVVLTSVPSIFARSRRRGQLAHQDVRLVHDYLSDSWSSRTDELRFLLGYLGLAKLTPKTKTLARSLSRRHREQRFLPVILGSRPRLILRLLQIAGRSLP